MSNKGTLDSESAWVAGANNNAQWMVVDAGAVTSIAGVVVQRRKAPFEIQHVQALKVSVSLDNAQWTAVDDGKPAN